ncbi:discoidin domain-containing protein [Paenibacillus paeoniae]|uniref:glucan endo-1,3-beta-D-glucosidase n=1 Tax=Paenibacillus paeoniae TaxID=2292705 RepID=A0A371PGG2_9BACL|nr:discoidin domain-containing protein [Paenibacillus paeoniae]REK75027.1 coagulation factor 5/8 type domain protein [Paenibacillus paeoniae]
MIGKPMIKTRRTVSIWTLLCLLVSCLTLTPAAAAPEPYLLSQNRPAYASTSLGANGPELAVDGNPTDTRWETQFGQNNQWMYVDLGAVASISRILIKWEGAYAKHFRVEVSNDEYTWTPIYTNTNFGGGTTDVAVSGIGRYVRLYVVERALTSYGVSVYEFEVYGTGGVNAPPKPPVANIALNKPAVSSSEQNDAWYLQPKDYETRNVTDGNRSTRWSSLHSDPQWVYVDLGGTTTIGKVILRWEAAFGRAYDIQVSNDASNWTTVYRELHGSGGTDEISLYAEGRYVRLLGIGRGTGFGYSLFEFEVFPYRAGDLQPIYSIPVIPAISRVTVGSGSYEINDIRQLEPLYPRNRTANIQSPIPSNDWWQNLLVEHLGNGTGIITLPLKSKYTKNGLGLMNPGAGFINGDGGAVNADGPPDLFVMASNITDMSTIESKVDGYGDYSVDVILSDDNSPKMRSTLVKGSPYTYHTFSNPSSVELYSPGITRLFNRNNETITLADGQSITGDHLGLEITNTDGASPPQTFLRPYGVFAPPGTIFTKAGNKLKIGLGSGQNYMSIAALPTSTDLNLFYQHGYAFITDTLVSYNYDMPQASVTTTFQSVTEVKRGGFSGDTLMAMLPHQWKASNASATGRTYPSIRGTLRVHEGNAFTTVDRFNGILPQFAEPNNAAYSRDSLSTYLTVLENELNNEGGLMNQDPYWQGKVLHPAALAAMISDSMGDTERRDFFLGKLRKVLVDWYTYSEEDALHTYYFHYSPDWGSIFPWAAGWGINTGLTDHHYTYGYFVYASAILAAFDPSFEREYGGMVEHLIRDYANPSRTDSMYPWFRSFDPYEGHSWAGAYADNNNGNNQEAAGEALNGWAGLYLWGVVTGNDAYRDAGAWGFTTELKAIEQYWFNYDGDNWIPEYEHGVAGQVWGSAYLYGTYFSGAPENIYGIHWLPTAEWMSYYGKEPQKAAMLYGAFLQDNDGPEEGWEHIIWPYQALSDPGAVIAKWNPGVMQQNEVFNAYWFIHNMESYGHRTTDVWADNWSSVGVYKKGNLYTAQVWNPTSAPITVQFRNASGVTGSVVVDPLSLIKTNPMEHTGENGPGGPVGGETALNRTGWTASSSPSSGDEALNLLDGSMQTRWSAGTAMAPGQSLIIDMKAAKSFNKIVMDSTGSNDDYARSYEVYVSNDGVNYGSAVVSGTGSGPVVAAVFPVQSARYIKIVQTGTASNWWSIRELNVYTNGSGGNNGGSSGAELSRSGWAAASSPSSGDAAVNLLDGDMSTRWSTGAAMAPGQSLTVDMGSPQRFSKIIMDSTGSNDDFARGYELYVSQDGVSYGNVIASGLGSGPLVTVQFPQMGARYIKIVQTGTASNWWSIREFKVYN